MDTQDVTPWTQVPPDACRGQYLCEVCEEVMTDGVMPDPTSPMGEEIAVCGRCQAVLGSST